MAHSMDRETARVYRQALTYGLDERAARYASAVAFAHYHANVGRLLFDDDLDRSWDDWTQRPEAQQVLGEDLS